jgi:hypothetical protein
MQFLIVNYLEKSKENIKYQFRKIRAEYVFIRGKYIIQDEIRIMYKTNIFRGYK